MTSETQKAAGFSISVTTLTLKLLSALGQILLEHAPQINAPRSPNANSSPATLSEYFPADKRIPIPTTHTMNKPAPTQSLRKLAGWLFMTAAPFALYAQTVPATSPTKPDDDIVVLSPFEVSTKRDVGFAAASAQAGGRLVTDLKDTPVSYSVINSELIQALGITDLTQAAEWTTSTFKFPDGAGGGDLYNITTPISVRGVSSNQPLRQRNFFPYFSENDSYNIERFDFGRGPNQVLFGNGTIGGTQVTMTKRARFDKSFRNVELSYGSWNNIRTVIDVNQPLGNHFALRGALLLADRDGWRDHEMETRNAGFLTGTVKVFKNTEIRIDGELGETQRRIPDAKLTDRFGGWNGAYTASYLSALPGNSGALGINRSGGNYFVYNPTSGPNAIMGYTDWAITRGAGDTNTTAAGNYYQVGTASWNQSNATLLNAVDVAPGRFDKAIANSQFRVPDRSFTNSPDTPTINSKYYDAQITLSQRVGSNLYFELAADANRVKSVIMNRMEGDALQTYIDINPTLPNGATNPNFLQPYGDGRYSWYNTATEAKSIRAAVAYILDLDKWGKYSFNLMGGLTNQLITKRNTVLASGVSDGQLADPRQWASDANALRQRFYWNDNHAYMPPTGPMTYVTNKGAVTTITPTWVPAAGGTDSTNAVSDNDNDYNYILGAVNAKFFKDRLVILGAMRYDDSEQQVRYLKRIGDFPSNWDKQTLYWRPDAPSNWTTLAATRPRTNNTYGIAVNNPSNPANARYGDDYNPPSIKAKVWTPSTGAVLHTLDWLSFFGNYSKAISFNTSAAPDVNGQLLPVVQGKGYDYGVRFIVWKNRINFSVTGYNNEEYGNYVDPTSVTNQINTLYQANVYGDTTIGGRNKRNATDINALVRDTRTRISKGYEFELVANITKSWRMMANLGLPDVSEKNYGPMTRSYAAANADLFKQILDDAGGMISSNGTAVLKPGVPDTGTAGSESTGNEAQRAATAYNNIYANLANFAVAPRKSTNAPAIFNVFTDYTFRSGVLNGLSAGAGANWRGRRIIGYRGGDTIVDPNDPTKTKAIDDPTVDGYTPVYGPGATVIKLTLGYTIKLKQGRSIAFNFQVNNAFNESDVIWTDNANVLRPKNGDFTSPARETVYGPYAYQIPRSYSMTARFNF